MSNLMSEESLNSYPILRSDETSVSKHLLIIYPFIRASNPLLLLILLYHLMLPMLSFSIGGKLDLIPKVIFHSLLLSIIVIIEVFEVASLLDIQSCILVVVIDPGL